MWPLFVDLKRESIGRSVSVAERSVVRSRADDRKPGACTTEHPWKAKQVGARLDELRKDLARIKRKSREWDEKAYEDAVGVVGPEISRKRGRAYFGRKSSGRF